MLRKESVVELEADMEKLLAKVIKEPVALIAHPLMGEGVVRIVSKERITLSEHIRRIGLIGLPLGRLFPDGLSVAYGQVETCANGRRRDVVVVGSLSIAHIVE